ncbi:hypothetical protein IPL68_05440 [Candidatus Saccharibacteria bacterium]|nr:MAG: hypothetical protein IPL68_05440 [Candidatus Saccharibacteria bacterium]
MTRPEEIAPGDDQHYVAPEETMEAMRALPGAVAVGAAAVLACLLHMRNNSPGYQVPIDEMQKAILRVGPEAETGELNSVFDAIHNARVPGVSLAFRRDRGSGSTILRLRGQHSIVSPEVLDLLREEFPSVMAALDYADSLGRASVEKDEKPSRFRHSEMIERLLIGNPGVAIGSRLAEQHALGYLQSLQNAATLRRVVPKLAIGSADAYYQLILVIHAHRGERVFYARQGSDAPVLVDGKTYPFTTLSGLKLDLVVSRRYPSVLTDHGAING